MAVPAVEFPAKLQPIFASKRYKVIYGGRDSAKCLALGTKVIMADGTLRAIEDVVVGDQVMGPDSRPRNVLSTTRGHGPLFRVKQSCAADYVVNEHHILSVVKSAGAKRDTRPMPSGALRSPRGRYPGWSDVVNIDVQSYAKQPARWRYHFPGYKAGLISFPEKAVALDPYILGAWLGDGTEREPRMTSADVEVIAACAEFVARFGGHLGFTATQKSAAWEFGLVASDENRRSPVWRLFERYGLLGNKHIPQDYLCNSEAVRLQLLAGLLDTDGTRQGNHFVITQVRESLAHQIKYLADTLGFRTSINQRKTICANNGKRGIAWAVAISGGVQRIPCRVARKAQADGRQREDMNHLLSRLHIEPAGEGEWAGFALDGDHLFLLEDGTVTHNSWSTARAVLLMAASRPLRVVCAREIQESIKESLYTLLCNQIQAIPGLAARYKILATEIRCTFADGRESLFTFHGLKHNIDNIKSLEGADIVLVEEAHNVSHDSWEKLIPTVRKPGSEIWVVFNPELETDDTYVRFISHPPPPDEALIIKMNWQDNPWFSKVLDGHRRKMQLEDPDGYAHVYGGFCKQTLTGAVYADELRAATEQGRITRVPYDRSKGVNVFCDLGYGDNTSLWFIQRVAMQYRALRAYQNRHKLWAHYLEQVQQSGYIIDTIYLPHDGASGQLGTGKSIEQLTRDAGFRCIVVPRRPALEGINAVRTVFPEIWFDAEGCADGLQALRRYVWEDNAAGVATREPKHDDASHFADALRTFGVGFNESPPPSSRAERVARELGRREISLEIPTGGDAGWMSN